MTLYRAIRRGDFPAMRVGNRVVVPARAIEELIDATVAEGVVDTSGWALVRK